MLAAPGSDPIISAPIVVILALSASVIFTVGYRLAVNQRANKDYKTTKAALPKLRKGFWSTWVALMKVAAVLAVISFILIAWVVNDFKDLSADPQPSPSPSVRHRK